MNRDRVRSTPIGTWTGGQNPGGAVNVGRFFPAVGGIALPKAGSGAAVKRVQIQSILPDTLSCLQLAATSDEGAAPAITVAKPYHLRDSLYSGQTISGWTFTYTVSGRTRVASGIAGIAEGATLDEIVWPFNYYAGEVIYVAESQNDTELIGGVRLDWIDLNVVARTWVPGYTEVLVCEDGATRYILVQGGPTYA